MDLGIHYFSFTHPEWETTITDRLSETARVADEGGVAVLSVMDHWFQMESIGGPFEPMLEGYTTLAFLAGITSRIGLRTLVTGVTYRHPGLLAKTATTLDVLTGGRFVLGIGAAWYEREHAGLGVPFPPLSERFERLEEALQIFQQMWSDDDGPYVGKHYQLAETICLPKPVAGTVPILIGGAGERKTLRLVAQYAQACNLFAMAGPDGVEAIRHKLDVLRSHCDRLGTDYDAISKTVLYRPLPLDDPDTFLREMEAYAELGVALVESAPPPYEDPARWTTRVVETIVPRLAQV
jgi:F420-dependent oxidoreductase-like protein